MIHNRTMKEVRRYDIFKLVVLLFLLVLLIFVVIRNESGEPSTADEGGTSTAEGAYPASDESAPSPANEGAYPGESYPGAETGAPNAPGEAYPAPAEGAYPAGETGAGSEQPQTTEPSGYPGPAGEAGETTPAAESTEQPGGGSEPGSGDLAFSGLEPGAIITSGPLTLSGTGTPGNQVRITSNGQDLGLAQVNPDGSWQLDADIPEGDTTIAAQMVDPSGNVISTSTVQVQVVADTTPVEAPEVALNPQPLYGGESELEGTGIPGSTIVVLLNNQQAATAEVKPDGRWSTPVQLEPGDQSIVLQTVDDTGAVLDETEPLPVTVDEPISPEVDLPTANVYAYSLTISGTGQPKQNVRVLANEQTAAETTVGPDGNWTAELNLVAGTYNIDVASLDSSGNIIEQVPGLTLPVLALPGPMLKLGESNAPQFNPRDGLFDLKGVADPGTNVIIIANGENLGTATAAEDGHWSLESALTPGEYDVSVDEEVDGQSSGNASQPITIIIPKSPPTLNLSPDILTETETGDSEITSPAGPITWSGLANPDSRVAVIINKEVTVTAVAGPSGDWSVEGELAPEDTELQVGLLDENGDVAIVSESIPISISGTQETVLYPVEVDSSNGNAVASGTTTPNTEVELLVNGLALTSTTSDESGNFTIDIRLGPGNFEIQAQALDEQGNVISSSETETVHIAAPETAAENGTTSVTEEEETVIAAADSDGEFNTLLAGLEASGISDRLSIAEDAYTLFAPTDAAFEHLPQEVLDAWNENPDAYAEMLFYLILEGEYTEEELLQAQVLTTMGDINIGITTDGQNTLVNGVPIHNSIPAGNSIVYAIEQVILPPLGLDTQPPIINESGVPVFTGTFLTVVGTAEPGKQILVQVSGENFGDIVTVGEDGRWQVSDNISTGVQEILAYMLDTNGTLMAISQQVNLPVQ